MEEKIVLLPLEGVRFGERMLRLGDGRAAAEELLGPAEWVYGNRCYYRNQELGLDFDEGDTLQFIEFLGGEQGELSPELYGCSVFYTNAEELIGLLGQYGEVVDEDGGYTMTIPTISIGLYREVTPADVETLSREVAQINMTTLGHVNLAAEQARAARWETIGIGIENYYS